MLLLLGLTFCLMLLPFFGVICLESPFGQDPTLNPKPLCSRACFLAILGAIAGNLDVSKFFVLGTNSQG